MDERFNGDLALRGLKDFERERKHAIEELVRSGILRSPLVIEAMMKVPREEFIPPAYKSMAYVDAPIPIGYGQTTSALHMTAWLCEAAELQPGQKVLEVGGGCGYMAAVYAEIVGRGGAKGHVYTIEIIPQLAKMARENLQRLGYSNRVTVIEGDGTLGYEPGKPYDAIIVTAASPDVPKPLTEQLKMGGRLLIPIGSPGFYQDLVLVRKVSESKLEAKSLGGCAFVPLRGKYGWR